MYALLTAAATLVGGSLPLLTRLRHLEKRYTIAFAGGAMVSIALFDLIPQMQTHNAAALAAGFFSIYLIEKLVLIHVCGEAECEVHSITLPAVVGIATESLIDGIAIAVSYRVEPALGTLVAVAVFAHELPRGFATTVIMRGAGHVLPVTLLVLAVDASFTPLGVLVAEIFPSAWLEPLLGFTAGVFLYVGASDLIPEAHRRFNSKVVLATLAGAALIPAVSAVLE
jgi:zinc transporter ZupT